MVTALDSALILGFLSAVPAHAALPDWPLLPQKASGNNAASLRFLLRQQGGSVKAAAEFDAQKGGR
ncbi:hypothetical protein [Streptomyces sp. NPDC048266]|uniref:hypothetical protein n=1 Tax=Streptomyces sp. NPDC048266 TaxID=3155787 RepID=UPI0033CEB200